VRTAGSQGQTCPAATMHDRVLLVSSALRHGIRSMWTKAAACRLAHAGWSLVAAAGALLSGALVDLVRCLKSSKLFSLGQAADLTVEASFGLLPDSQLYVQY
jgi:hypothetical protein